MDIGVESSTKLGQSTASDWIKKREPLHVPRLIAERSPPKPSPMDISDESTATVGPSSKSPERSLPGPSPNQISQNGGHENVELLRHSIAN